MTSPAKQAAFDWVEANAQALSDWNQVIWHYAEPALREYKSAAWYVERLRAEGFDVEAGSGGMPTAFVATFSSGAGPTIGAYAEYDAVPGNCQAASTKREPRAGLSRFAAGHTDPHSALGIGALGGLLAAKAAMQQHGLGGTLKFFGEPAEKLRLSKPFHAARGYYDGLDAVISFHPAYMLPLVNTVRWDTHCGAAYACVYSFLCESPETWLASGLASGGGEAHKATIPAAHVSARAPGATDALVSMYMLTKQTQSAMLPFSGGWSLSEAILTAGQATADNLPPQLAQIQYLWRTPTLEQAETVAAVLDNNATAAAKAAHCAVTKTWVTKSRPGLPNHALAALTFANLELAGPPRWGDEAIAAAQAIQNALGLEPMARPFVEACEATIAPQEAERLLRRDLPPWQQHSTSDDYTEYCWHAPTVRLYVGRPMLKAPDPAKHPGFAYPAWAMNALGGIPACIDPMILSASKTIGATILDLVSDPVQLAAARAEFEARTGGGIGGEHWLAPLLPADANPPIDLRWPEYVTTVRGEEWWIPVSEEF
ncbi:MAG: amidohydrolase [Kiloniellales bacterium]